MTGLVRGPLTVLAGVVAGIEAGARLGPDAAGVLLASGLVALVGAWFVGGPVRTGVAALALATLGCASMQRALDGLVHHDLEPGGVVTLEGSLAADPQPGRFRTDALVRIHDAGRTVLVRGTGTDAMRLAALAAGDRVVVDGLLAPLPVESRARWRHAVALLDDAMLVNVRGATGIYAAANALRDVVVRGTRPLAPEPRALLVGFLLGDTRGVPESTVAVYRDSGLAHLLAVSGANVAFVLALAGPALRRLRLGPRSACAIAVIVLFAAMTRFEPSVLRASVLATVSVLAGLAGRPQPALRALAITIVVLLLADPFLSRSTAFQLSCAASAGIILLARPLAARLRGPRSVCDALAVSIAAQAGVTPVLLVTFGTVPVATPVANLLAAPAAEALGVYGLLASIVGGLVAPLAPVLQPPSAWLVAWVTGVGRVTAAVGGSLDRPTATTLAAVVAVATLGRRALRPPAPR